MARSFRQLALAAARAAADKKGENVAVLHAGRRSPIADYLVIATALSRPHLEALENEVEKAAAELRFRCLRRSTPKSDFWRVLDFGGLIVHLMLAETRAFYALEKLHDGAPRLRFEDRAPRRPAARGPRAR